MVLQGSQDKVQTSQYGLQGPLQLVLCFIIQYYRSCKKLLIICQTHSALTPLPESLKYWFQYLGKHASTLISYTIVQLAPTNPSGLRQGKTSYAQTSQTPPIVQVSLLQASKVLYMLNCHTYFLIWNFKSYLPHPALPILFTPNLLFVFHNICHFLTYHRIYSRFTLGHDRVTGIKLALLT